jgi:ActR/RegA family two-component response regulator
MPARREGWAAEAAMAHKTRALAGKTVLIVEDDFLIADDIQEAMAAQGAKVLGPVPTVAEAMDIFAQCPANCAVLNVFLGLDTSLPIAEMLHRSGVPFVVVTGYEREALPACLQRAPCISKPYSREELVREVVAALAKGRRARRRRPADGPPSARVASRRPPCS